MANKEKAMFQIKCVDCERELFELQLTENMNFMVICKYCRKTFDLELSDNSKRINFMMEMDE